MKQRCLFGDICPFEDCEECTDFSPVDVNGMDELPQEQYKEAWHQVWYKTIGHGDEDDD